jgi:CheY-like chemotaxis protein
MYLPARPEAIRHEEVSPPALQRGEGKILVMDDEEGVRDVLTQMLALLGYEVESARNGSEAIALYRRAAEAGAPFVAVILDLIVMDGMGGREAMVQLRELDPQVNAIVSSGYSNDAIMANYAHYGFRDVLTKPYQLADLSAVLQRVIRSPRA